ncbi:hypothetical protein LG290_00575 [Halomonas sediminis]
MKKIDIMSMFEAMGEESLGDGARLVGNSDVIDIKKELVEMILVVQGMATVIYKDSGQKEVISVSRGEACFFGVHDESVILQEDSLVLVIDKGIKKNADQSGAKFGLFGKKGKADRKRGKSEDGVCEESFEQVSKKSILSDMMPKVRQAWYQVAGPLSASVINDENRFKELASTVYMVLPMPVRMVVREEFFINWCYEKRHILLVETPKIELENNDSLVMLTDGSDVHDQLFVDQVEDEIKSE